jgi:peptide/nickel transport system substrate-binding protein
VEVLTLNKGLVTNTLSSPAVDYYADIEKAITNKHAYDPRMAAQHLEEAGFVKQSNGFYADRSGKQLSIPVWSSSGSKNEREVAVYTDSLKRVGWDASINIFSAAQLADAQARALTPGLAVRGLGQKRLDTMTTEQIPRPETRWQGDNRGGWVSPDYDAAFAAYVKALDRPERIRQIVNMERIFAEDVGAIPHFFSATVNAYVSTLTGPVKRQTPESGIGYLYINKWEWKS